MPRGVDRRNDPRNDLTREGIRARLVSQTELTRDARPGVRISNYTDPEPDAPKTRWGDPIDPSKPHQAVRDFTPDPDLEEPTFLEGPLGYMNWTDARVNRYR